jgi:hypothetical protein
VFPHTSIANYRNPFSNFGDTTWRTFYGGISEDSVRYPETAVPHAAPKRQATGRRSVSLRNTHGFSSI